MTDVTPPLTEFLQAYEADGNAWWRLDSGHHMNLFNQALDSLDEARARIAELEAAQRPPLGYAAVTPVGSIRMERLTRDRAEAERDLSEFAAANPQPGWCLVEVREVQQ